jgi:cytochrome P450
MERVDAIRAHLRPTGTGQVMKKQAVDYGVMSRDSVDSGVVRGGATAFQYAEKTTARNGLIPRSVLESSFVWLNDETDGAAAGKFAAEQLQGPLKDPKYRDAVEVLQEVQKWNTEGHIIHLWTHFQKLYGSDGLSSNIVMPMIFASKGVKRAQVTNVVIVANPGDSERIARNHVKKMPNFTSLLAGERVLNSISSRSADLFLSTNLDSIISSTDNSHWKNQRNTLNTAFMPTTSLAHLFDTSVKRAAVARDLLAERVGESSASVDMFEFLGHEANAQLQLALFGADNEFMEKTNQQLRHNFYGMNENDSFMTDFVVALLQKIEDPDKYGKLDGPLARQIGEAGKELGEGHDALMNRYGNGLIFSFAGHVTTGATMSWLIYEMAQRPDLQKRVQTEVDALFALMDKRPLEYRDCRLLPFLTRCVVETLRLWPAVPQGTFRELQYDDYVLGKNGEQVKLPKGTYCQVEHWSRHRDTSLWGDDANTFNPDREFTQDELWNDGAFMAYNPSTPRFTPFTHPPRDCIGKNFAQMEMRTILSHLFRDFEFELEGPTNEFKDLQRGNAFYGVLYPEDMAAPPLEFKDGLQRRRIGLQVRVKKRER